MKNELISIKPKGIFSLISETFSLYFRFLPQIFTVVTLSFLIYNFDKDLLNHPSSIVQMSSFIIFLIFVPCNLICGWTFYKVTMQSYNKEQVNWKTAFILGKKNFVSCFKTQIAMTALLIPSCVFTSFHLIDNRLSCALFIAAPFCLNMAIDICLALIITLSDGSKSVTSRKRSKELLKGSKLRLLATFLPCYIFVFVSVLAVSKIFIIFNLNFSSKYIYNFAYSFAGSTIPILTTLFYYDLIARKQLQNNT